ncbi:MAG TPA: tRNA (adenosine(37)-N6)-threonylcarbamoyltransferase complex ATPase subunit type 1 TsaE [Bacteroidia bacterium]|jgi:tRNA threonylcarbamoyladenosine biosynthesis protein TsaE|nr:tRNA (adenosine(37)-N6)-threonylcarbamoyltransferase complex ATPase subunit type 1 TsaE [Bacteroidia bacterium]
MSTITLTDLSELPSIAKKLLESLDGEKVVAFHGEMGAGKTTLIKAMCEALGVVDTVSSPTFSIVNEYRTASGQKIYHFDFYRIKSVEEAYDMGYEEYFYSKAYCFIEWPEKIGELMPLSYEKISIEVKGEKRIITY